MELLSIGVKDDYKQVKRILDRQLELFKSDGLYIDIELNNFGDINFLRYATDDTKYNSIKKIFIHYIANSIADIIVGLYQDRILSKLINENYYYFARQERDIIKNKAKDILNKTEDIITEGMTYRISRKARILKSVIEYLELNNEIILEGFINFRLRYFIDSIEEALEKAAEDVILEKEYREFIKILQYFVDIQDPKVEVVNVIIGENKRYLLFDEKKRLINNDLLEEIADELTENDMNYDDLLISSLITIAPRNIIIHIGNGDDDSDIVKIIQGVFSDKVTLCRGCDFCIPHNSMNSNIINKDK